MQLASIVSWITDALRCTENNAIPCIAQNTLQSVELHRIYCNFHKVYFAETLGSTVLIKLAPMSTILR